jgi:hypothetical protein
MAHGRDKPGREKRKPKKAKTPTPTATSRSQEILSHVSGQDQHRWTTEQQREEP